MARLPGDTPAKHALNKYTRTKKCRRDQKLTWLKIIKIKVKLLDIDIELAIERTQNIEQWRSQIERLMKMS